MTSQRGHLISLSLFVSKDGTIVVEQFGQSSPTGCDINVSPIVQCCKVLDYLTFDAEIFANQTVKLG
jgi:hypothetical protein